MMILYKKLNQIIEGLGMIYSFSDKANANFAHQWQHIMSNPNYVLGFKCYKGK